MPAYGSIVSQHLFPSHSFLGRNSGSFATGGVTETSNASVEAAGGSVNAGTLSCDSNRLSAAGGGFMVVSGTTKAASEVDCRGGNEGDGAGCCRGGGG